MYQVNTNQVNTNHHSATMDSPVLRKIIYMRHTLSQFKSVMIVERKSMTLDYARHKWWLNNSDNINETFHTMYVVLVVLEEVLNTCTQEQIMKDCDVIVKELVAWVRANRKVSK